MRSSNPVFSRRGFTRGDQYAGFGAQGAQGAQAGWGAAPGARQGNPFGGQGGNPYAQGPRNPYDQPQGYPAGPDDMERAYGRPAAGPAQTGRMTIDDVVMRTAMTLGVVILGAVLAWFALPNNWGLAAGAAVIAFVLVMVQSFRRTVSPALVLGYAIFEGVFLGVISRMYNEAWQGAPVQAVMGTLAVFAGVLIAYRTRIIRVTTRYRRIGFGIAIGFLVLIVVNLLFAAFGGGDGLGFRTGGLGILFGIVGVLLGGFFLSLNFQDIEDGIRGGAPQQESWLAALGLTVTLVWIYLELLRLISILRD
jgi:uncharacterized YccA/Bax inhibitor family protein